MLAYTDVHFLANSLSVCSVRCGPAGLYASALQRHWPDSTIIVLTDLLQHV